MRKGEQALKTKSGLTPLQENFAHEYLVDLDPGKAYTRAGYSMKAKNEETAKRYSREHGLKLLKNHKIAMRIRELTDQRARTTDVTAERVVLELSRIGFSDLRSFMSWGPAGAKWTPSDELSDDAAAVVQEIYETEREMDDGGVYRTKRFKLHDKMAALKELARHTGVGQADKGLNVNVNIEAERAKAGEMERLFSDIDNWRAEQEKALPEERIEAE